MKRLSYSSIAALVISVLIAVTLAACGGGGPAATALPTFTPIPTYVFVEPTGKPIEAATAEATAESGVLDAAVVARGKGRYDALDCASCHGANGEGTDKGSSMVISIQTEDEFFAFIRSGGKLGTAHQYPANRLSDTGGKTLYQYLLSLRTAS